VASIEELVASVKQNDNTTLKKLYQLNYKKVEVLVLRNSGTVDNAKDIYQEAFLTTWQKIKKGDFIPTSESYINGFIFTVAKNKWLDVLRSKKYKDTSIMSQIEGLQIASENEIMHHDHEEDPQMQMMMTAFASLGDACKDLLKKFYFEKLSMNAIAAILNLDAASVRNKKYRCMERLRKKAQEKA
jgi:RNA polymerase sigma factor (sigma-70 family)